MIPELRRVVEIVGSLRKLGNEIGCDHALFVHWKKVPEWAVPKLIDAQQRILKERSRQIAKLRIVGRHELRPDLYYPNGRRKNVSPCLGRKGANQYAKTIS